MSIASPLWGVDVSNHQGYVSWADVPGEGFTFAICKASEGTYYRDTYCSHNLYWMQERGLVNGSYHFLTNENIDTQLDLFLDQVGDPEGRLLAVDVEATNWGGDPTTTDVWNFVHGLYERTNGHPILIYSGWWYWNGYLGNPDLTSLVNTKKCSIWVSRYVTGSGYASVLYQSVPEKWWRGLDAGGFGGQDPTILQFSDSAYIAGQYMDANAYPGSKEELVALTTAGKSEPAPESYWVQALSEGHTKTGAEELAAECRSAGWDVTVGKA